METEIDTMPGMILKYLSTQEAADSLGVSRSYIYWLRDTRRIKMQKIGNQWVISEKELERYKAIRNQKVEHEK